MTLECYCRKVQITVEGEPAMVVACHCDDCRRWGGVTFQAAKLFPADKITIVGETISARPLNPKYARHLIFGC